MTQVNNQTISELAQVGLLEATKIIPVLTSFSTTFRTGLKWKDTVKVPVYSAGGATSAWDKATNNYSHTGGVIDMKDSALTGRFKQGFSVEDYVSGVIDRKKGIQMASLKVMRDALDFILAGVTLANYGAPVITGVAAADFGDDDLETLETYADDQNWDDDRALILKPAYYNRLVKSYGASFVQGGDGSIIRSSKLGDILGFNTVRGRVPANGEKLAGFACTRSALACVVGTIAPADGNTISYEVAEDPSGFALGVRQHYDPDVGEVLINVEIICSPGVKGTAELARITTP